MKKYNKPLLIRKKKYKDYRGFFQELFLRKEIKSDIKFTAIAHSKKKRYKRSSFSTKK